MSTLPGCRFHAAGPSGSAGGGAVPVFVPFDDPQPDNGSIVGIVADRTPALMQADTEPHAFGLVGVLLEPGLVPIAGQVLYLSAATEGRATTVKPAASGNVAQRIGILFDASGYDSLNGSAQPTVLLVGEPVLVP